MAARPWLRASLCLSLTTLSMLFSMPGAGSPAAACSAFLVAGVPGSTVDVLIDDHVVKTGVTAKSVIGPVRIARGEHTVTYRSTGWTATADFTADRPSIDVVVHRPADPTGDPKVTVFPNDLSPITANKARLTIAHTAIVPPADVRVSGKVLFANIANGEYVTAEVPPKTYSVDIVPTGGSKPVFGPVDVTLKAGALNRVFAIGDPQDGTMDAIVQVLPLKQLGAQSPSSVHAGSAGLVAPERSAANDGMVAVGALAALAVLGAALTFRRRVTR
jgi:hypothetical protein